VVITAIYEGDRLVGFAKVTRDLTEQRAAEIKREEQERLLSERYAELQRALEAKSRFLSTISHEVRTPMAGVIGLTEILSKQDLGRENNETILAIFESSKRLLQMLNNVLDSAKLESGKLILELRRFPVRSVLGDVRQIIARDACAKGLKVTGRCEDCLPEYVYGDESRIRQVLLNLAVNAVKFTQNGWIDISAFLRGQTEAETTIRFVVTDTGVGIPEEMHPVIFQPFEQATPSALCVHGGTGLGLSICTELVKLMHGEIGVISQAGSGSTFWFEVPFIKDSQRI
jgi:signal transduction histidine kinase